LSVCLWSCPLSSPQQPALSLREPGIVSLMTATEVSLHL
jgi:hypothetical protein